MFKQVGGVACRASTTFPVEEKMKNPPFQLFLICLSQNLVMFEKHKTFLDLKGMSNQI